MARINVHFITVYLNKFLDNKPKVFLIDDIDIDDSDDINATDMEIVLVGKNLKLILSRSIPQTWAQIPYGSSSHSSKRPPSPDTYTFLMIFLPYPIVHHRTSFVD
ncbi:hypothetical protein RJ639_029659 [Escallonia herrerae]|uniref:Uncharacterized protein n=1 Tax=Escallonia herrerae TaxID=1293975 RepID=A0AA89BCH4_9ASTE|nr:hypothetical protein RJ639_029659 [Escallonia herrerae]